MMKWVRDLVTAVQDLVIAARDLRAEVQTLRSTVAQLNSHRAWEQRLLEMSREDQRVIRNLYHECVAAEQKRQEEEQKSDEVFIRR